MEPPLGYMMDLQSEMNKIDDMLSTELVGDKNNEKEREKMAIKETDDMMRY